MLKISHILNLIVRGNEADRVVKLEHVSYIYVNQWHRWPDRVAPFDSSIFAFLNDSPVKWKKVRGRFVKKCIIKCEFVLLTRERGRL